MCNCWLGFLNAYEQTDANYLYLDSIAETLERESEGSVRIHAVAEWFEILKPRDYIDRRRGLATLFNYCPLCGKKINWRKIRKEVEK